jgi:hypothetical protein
VPPPWLFFLALSYHAFSSIFLLASVRRRIPPARMSPGRPGLLDKTPGRCERCDYDLAGLPTDAPCPECGARHATRTRPRLLMVHPFRLRQWRFTLIGLVAAIVLPWPMAYWPLILAYRSEGFTLAQALHCIPIRELRPDGPGPGAQTWPFMLTAAVSPLFIWLFPPHRTRTCLLILWAVGLLASVANTFLEH